MAVAVASLYEAAKVADVQPEIGARIGADLLAVYDQPFASNAFSGATGRGASTAWARLGASSGHSIAISASAADRPGHGRIGAQGQDLAGVELQRHAGRAPGEAGQARTSPVWPFTPSFPGHISDLQGFQKAQSLMWRNAHSKPLSVTIPKWCTAIMESEVDNE